MKLVDADKVLEKLEKIMNRSEGSNVSLDYIIGLRAGMTAVKIADNVDVEPVKHGHWVEREGKHYCSLCCGHAPFDREFHERLPEWCCGCGAKMDEKEKNNEKVSQ